MAKQIINLPAFLGNDYAYLTYARQIHLFLASCGWTCTNTSLTVLGQNIFDRPTAHSNKYYLGWLAPITPELAFNGSTSDLAIDTTNALPTISDPTDFIYDFGTASNGSTDVTHVITSYKVYFDNYAGDPSAWVFSVSSNLVTWTDVDTQTAQSAPGGAGYNTYSIGSPASATRYIRWRFTNNQNQSSNFRIREIQALNSNTVLTNIPNSSLLSPAFTRNMWSYQETWTPGDSLQSTNPYAINIWYGASGNYQGDNSFNGSGTYAPTFLYQISAPNVYNSTTSQWSLGFVSNTNDSGNSRGNAYYTNNDPSQGCCWLMRGDSSSFVIGALMDTNFVLGNGYGSPKWIFSVERLRDTSGSYIGDGLSVITSGGNMCSVVVPTYGVYQGAEGSYPCLMNTTSAITGLAADPDGSQKVYLMHLTPFYKFSQPPMLNCANYYTSDITTNVPFTTLVYGASHLYYPLGNGWNPMYRGTAAAGISLAIRWDS